MSYFDQDRAFGVVTVMDACVYTVSANTVEGWSAKTPVEVYNQIANTTSASAASINLVANIKYMQAATLSTDGPEIDIQGGKYNNHLLKYGKTARCEITDALAEPDALAHLGGFELANGVLSVTDKFGGPVTIVGDTFVVDQATGQHIQSKVLMYQFMPDAIPTVAFEAGSAATFDMNGDLLAVDLKAAASADADNTCPSSSGYFYSIIPVADCNIANSAAAAANVEKQ